MWFKMTIADQLVTLNRDSITLEYSIENEVPGRPKIKILQSVELTPGIPLTVSTKQDGEKMTTTTFPVIRL